MTAARQLAFGFAHAPSLAAADFCRGAANEAALAMIERWPAWPARRLALWGPEGSGKTHLLAIWCARSSARALCPADLARDEAPALIPASGHVARDDADCVLDEPALLHLLNLVSERGGSLLLTAREAPARWGTRLADLRSRLRSITAVALGPPDEALLRAVLTKLFADRQLAVAPPTIDYILRRIDRSLAAARELVARLDRIALARGVQIGAALVREALAREEDGGGEYSVTVSPGAPKLL